MDLPTISASWVPTIIGNRTSLTLSLAMKSAFPPRRMSVPLPAMLVEMVTAPSLPLCATISLSLWTFSGLAFSSWYEIPSPSSCSASRSLSSTEVVPTRTGLPVLCILRISIITAFHFPFSDRKTTSGLSVLRLGLFVGTTDTSRP